MMPAPEVSWLFWRTVLAHLWETALVWGVLAGAAVLLRDAPAAQLHRLWRIALVKILVPVGLLAAGLRALAPGEWLQFFRAVAELPEGTSWAAGRVLDPLGVQAEGVSLAPALDGVLAGAGLLWVLVGAVLLVRLGLHALREHRSLAEALPVHGAPEECEALRTACRGAGVPVEALRIAPAGGAPATGGFLRPRIVMPLSLVRDLDREELIAVLRHEDAHRRRRDPAWNLLRGIALALFAFFPPLHQVVRRLDETAEFACDEAALERGSPPRIYASALARTVRAGLGVPSLSSAASGGGRSLLRRRFARLEQPRRKETMRSTRWIFGGACVAVLALTLVPLALQAGGPAAKASATEAAADEGFDTPPAPVQTVAPKYPEVCREAEVSGTVHVEVTVSKEGRVSGARVTKNVEECPALGKAGLDAARQWTFEPARKDGKPVAARIVIPFKFALH